MGKDEIRTLKSLESHRRELVDPRIAAHRWRTVKITGDGTLVEFPSVVDATDLSMIHDIVVEQHGGSIKIEPGAFTEFRASLPRTSPSDRAATD